MRGPQIDAGVKVNTFSLLQYMYYILTAMVYESNF